MEKLELTPVELMSVLGWKKSKVYYWINSGKFETISKMGIQKVVISNDDIETLKKSNGLKQFENVENSSENFEDVQENPNENVTKNYKNVSTSFNLEALELLNNSLETIKQIHQSSIINYGTTVKLLTDGQNSLEKENLELKAEKKSVEESLKQSEKENLELKAEKKSVEESLKQSEKEFAENLRKFEKKDNYKNIIILALVLLLIFSFIGFYFVLNNLKISQTVQENSIETQKEPMQGVTPAPARVRY